jgi:hypothetical protein
MPDFEALIRRQQDHQSTASERLSLVQPTPVSQAMGALLGSAGVQWALAMGWLRF